MGKILKVVGAVKNLKDYLPCCKQEKEIVEVQTEKKVNPIVIILAVIGALTVVAGIAYAVYRIVTPKYLDDFDDDFEDDFEDDFDAEDDEDEEVADTAEAEAEDEDAKEE